MSGSEINDKPDETLTGTDVSNCTSTEPKLCGVCHQNESKYKCSRCELPYCSVACSTLHKATHPALEVITAAVSASEDHGISNGTNSKPVSSTASIAKHRNPFSVLDESKELQTLFLMYPRLRLQLRNIYLATQPPSESGSGICYDHGDASLSYRGRGRGRGRGGGGAGRGGFGARDKGPWNPDKGTQDGIDALSRAKEEYGKAGEGMREYVALVMKLVNVDGIDVARMVQEEVAEENARIITQLLTGDGF